MLIYALLLAYLVYLSIIYNRGQEYEIRTIDVKDTLSIYNSQEIPHSLNPFKKGFYISAEHMVDPIVANKTTIQFVLQSYIANTQQTVAHALPSGPCTMESFPYDQKANVYVNLTNKI